jgi:hypothetical protein
MICQSYWEMYHWQSEHGCGTCVMVLRAVWDALSNSYHDRGPTAWPPRPPDLNPLKFCLKLLLAMKRHFTMALWMPVRLTATAPASLSGCGGPWWDVSRPTLNLTEIILSTCYKCTISAVTQKLFPDMDIFLGLGCGTRAQSLSARCKPRNQTQFTNVCWRILKPTDSYISETYVRV